MMYVLSLTPKYTNITLGSIFLINANIL